MEMIKVKVMREVVKTICKKCDKEIFGTSEKMLNHNFLVHKIFCDKKIERDKE